MRFTLHYRGPLKPNANAKTKHSLRKHFHPQLKMLWSQEPLMNQPELQELNPPEGKISVVEQVGKFNFVPMISERLKAIATLNITYLRPRPAGPLFSCGGDIDNRLKTLLDALGVPKLNQVKTQTPDGDEKPFYCLLQDDSLVTGISVTTDQLLEPVKESSEVELLIQVQTRITEALLGNFSFNL